MRKFILHIAGFFIFFISFYLIALFVFGSYLPDLFRPNLKHFNGNYGSTNSMLTELKEKKDVDILILGASDAYRGYDPRIFESYGYNIFNLGSSSQTPAQTYLILKKYLDRLNPKLIVYEVSPVCLALDGVESSLDLILNNIDEKIAVQLISRNPNILLINSFLYSIMNRYLVSHTQEKKFFVSGEEHYISGGYVETKMKYNNCVKVDSGFWTPNPEQVQKFDAICELMERKKIKLLLINANSITDRYYRNKETIDSFFAARGNYTNMNKELIMDDRAYFFDTSHLNQSGVYKFNDYLINQKIKALF